MSIWNCSKFFGQPNGAAKPPPQQTKLSFATKSSGKTTKTEESEDDEPVVKKEVEETSKVRRESLEDASAKENDEPVSDGGMPLHGFLDVDPMHVLTYTGRKQEAHTDVSYRDDEELETGERKDKSR